MRNHRGSVQPLYDERLPKTEILANIANILHTTSDYLIGNDANYGYDQLKILLASSKDNLSLNQKKELTKILMDEYKRGDGGAEK